MNRPPCIRGLPAYEKGCPRHAWNGESGCPAWVDVKLALKGGAEFLEVKECLDLYMARLHYSTNVLLEGNQQAVESFRNNMSTPQGPKPDPAVVGLVKAIQSHQRRQIS